MTMNTPVAKSSTEPRRRELLRALIVDDDAFQLDYLAELLRALGVRDISTASSGDQALALMSKSQSPFDLMLVDLYMPGMDGFQFMGSVAQRGFRGGLIIVSGESSDVLHSASLVAELRNFTLLGSLPKPVSQSGLSELLAKLI